MSAAAREATGDYSTASERSPGRGSALPKGWIALLTAAAAGAAMLAISEVLPLYDVLLGAAGTEVRTEPGWSTHAFAMGLLALASIPMLRGARGGARPPMVALAAIGAVALLVVLAVDLPAVRADAELREAVAYEDAHAEAAIGFYVETLGAVLLLVAGGLMALAPRLRRGGAGGGATRL